jgi:ribosomal protein RSM22 (predicted rRNA methylase)
LQGQKSYKSIYSKPANLNTRNTLQSSKKRKKGRGFQSQNQMQINGGKQENTREFSKLKRKTSTSRFSAEALTIPFVTNRNNNGLHLPNENNINVNNFKSHLVTEKYKNIDIHSKHRYTSKDRDTVQQTILKSRAGRGSSGSLITGLPSGNTNHHYGLFFNTNSETKKSIDFNTGDKKRMKNLKHFQRIKNPPKLETMGRYYVPLTERNNLQKRNLY